MILNDFLSLDRLEQGNIEVEQDTFDIVEFMDEVVEDVKLLRKKGQNIDLSYQGNSVVILDQKKLRYILVNLLSNAIKYSPHGSPVKISTDTTGDVVFIVVQDYGIGIPEDEQKYLYNKFFRARNTGNIQGTGLGLTIVKRYVELMGGKVSFFSRVGEGTKFIIELPKKKTS